MTPLTRLKVTPVGLVAEVGAAAANRRLTSSGSRVSAGPWASTVTAKPGRRSLPDSVTGVDPAWICTFPSVTEFALAARDDTAASLMDGRAVWRLPFTL